MCFIGTPEPLLEPEARVRTAGVRPLYRRGFAEPQAPHRHRCEVLKRPATQPNGAIAMMSDDEILAEFRAAEALLDDLPPGLAAIRPVERRNRAAA